MTMTRPAPSESPATSPSSSASAGVAASSTGARAPTSTVMMRRLTAQKLSKGVAEIGGEARDAVVADQFLPLERPPVGVGHRQPPVGVVVHGPGQVGLPQVTDGV